MALEVHAGARGLLVLSETFYPGWHAVVNGNGQRIYRVNGDLRGIIVRRGTAELSWTTGRSPSTPEGSSACWLSPERRDSASPSLAVSLSGICFNSMLPR